MKFNEKIIRNQKETRFISRRIRYGIARSRQRFPNGNREFPKQKDIKE